MVRNITKFVHYLTVVLSFLIVIDSPSLADVGGGSGRPNSPYLNMDLPEDIETVTRLRDEAATSRIVNFTTPSGTHVFGQRAGFAYTNGGAPLTEVEYGLVGVVDPEKTPRRIDFSIVRMITLVSKNSSTLTVRVDLFPDITPKELIQTRPSYSDLKKKYTATRIMNIPLRTDNGQQFSLVSKAEGEGVPFKVLAFLRDIPIGQQIEIYGAPSLWWAIGSVTEDLAYPHRVIFKK